MSPFPATNRPLLRVTLVLLVIGCLWLAVQNVLLAGDGDVVNTLVGLSMLPLAAGLWVCHPLARVVAMGILWCIVIVFPFGLINPFAAMDELGPNPPTVSELLWKHVAPWVIPALAALFVLSKYKTEFRWPGKSAARQSVR